MRSLPPACSLLVSVAAALTFAGPASAGQMNLRWSACLGDGGTVDRAFACDTNSGSEVLVGSFTVPHDIPNVTAVEVAVDIGTGGFSLPSWWEFKNAGTCRQGSLGIVANALSTAVNCQDWVSGGAVGLIGSYLFPFGSPTGARVIATVTSQAPTDVLAGGQEYFAFALTINHQKTVGAGSCAGCSVPACIALKNFLIHTVVPADQVQLFPTSSDDRLITWQGGAGVITPIPGGNTRCAAATPALNSTWGAVKALYR